MGQHLTKSNLLTISKLLLFFIVTLPIVLPLCGGGTSNHTDNYRNHNTDIYVVLIVLIFDLTHKDFLYKFIKD